MTEREAIANIEYARKWLGSESDFSDEALDMAIFALKKLEEDRWIPVTERLPELDTDVLITDQYGDVWQAAYVDWCGIERFVSAEESITLEDVIAWKPLPEAYKTEEEA
jgi:hypothetical protein